MPTGVMIKLYYKKSERDKYDAMIKAYTEPRNRFLAPFTALTRGLVFAPGEVKHAETVEYGEDRELFLYFDKEETKKTFLRTQEAQNNLPRGLWSDCNHLVGKIGQPFAVEHHQNVKEARTSSRSAEVRLGKGLKADGVINKYNNFAKEKGAYKPGYNQPKQTEKGIQLTFPNDKERNEFLSKLAKDTAFTIYDDKGGALAFSTGDGVLLLNGDEGFEEAFKKAAKSSPTAAELKKAIAGHGDTTTAQNKSENDEDKKSPSRRF